MNLDFRQLRELGKLYDDIRIEEHPPVGYEILPYESRDTDVDIISALVPMLRTSYLMLRIPMERNNNIIFVHFTSQSNAESIAKSKKFGDSFGEFSDYHGLHLL